MAECEPVYEELPGWTEDITGCKSLDEFPENARHYVERVSQLVGIPLATFSVGPDRTSNKYCQKSLATKHKILVESWILIQLR